jgi:hypothetical protein
MRWWRSNQICPICKNEFELKLSGRRPIYCGRSCRQKAYRQRRKLALSEVEGPAPQPPRGLS